MTHLWKHFMRSIGIEKCESKSASNDVNGSGRVLATSISNLNSAVPHFEGQGSVFLLLLRTLTTNWPKGYLSIQIRKLLVQLVTDNRPAFPRHSTHARDHESAVAVRVRQMLRYLNFRIF